MQLKGRNKASRLAAERGNSTDVRDLCCKVQVPRQSSPCPARQHHRTATQSLPKASDRDKYWSSLLCHLCRSMFLQEAMYGSQRISAPHDPTSCQHSALQRLYLRFCFGTGEAASCRNGCYKQESPGLHICCAAALEQLALSFEHCPEAQSCCNGGLGSRVLHILLAEHLPPATPAEAPSSQAVLAAVRHA